MRKFSLKKVLFGLSVSLVLAMAIGSFALGEAQTPTSPRASEPQSVAATNDTGDFNVTGDTSGVSFSGSDGVLTVSGGSPTISMATAGATTSQRIEVTGASTITLAGVNIDTSTSSGAAFEIENNATFAVNILLADGSENFLTSAREYAGLQKNGSGDGIGELTIKGNGKLEATGGIFGAGIGGGQIGRGSNITISDNAVVTATGGHLGAGIGGGQSGRGSNITISGNAVVNATGGNYGAGIGSGQNGSGSSGNSLNGNVVVMAISGYGSTAALEGFTATDNGIVFTRQTDSGEWEDNMYGSVTIQRDVTFPASLTVGRDTQQTLTVASGATLTLSKASILTEGTKGSIDCQGTIATVVELRIAAKTTQDQTFNYKIGSTVQKYGTDLPSGYNWVRASGEAVDANTDVILNEHFLYTENAQPDLKVDDDAIYETDYLYDSLNHILTILTDKAMTIENRDTSQSTDWRIVIADNAGEVNLTLNGVNISTGNGAAFEIPNDYTSNVNITLKGENILKTSAENCAGLQKNGDSSVGMLTITGSTGEKAGKLTATGGQEGAGIGGGFDNTADTGYNGSNITITGGTVTATGGEGAAGIGGGNAGNGSDITISGGEVTANAGVSAAGIGGGFMGDGNDITISGGVVEAIGGYGVIEGVGGLPGAGIGGGASIDGQGGEASGNKLDGDAVVLAVSGDTSKEALQGFVDESGESTLTRGIAFTGVGEYDIDPNTGIGTLTGITWDESNMYGNSVTVTADVKFPISLEVPDGCTIKNNANLTLADRAEITCSGTGKVETQLKYDPQGGEIVTNDDEYITYQNASGVQTYGTMPSAEKDEVYFDGWYSDKKGEGTKVDATSNVLLNAHVLYANWTTDPGPGPEPQPTPPGPQPGPEPTPEPTPDPSVDPDGDGGSGSGASSKTSDPFMGGIALALLGVATTGAVLVRKRK